MFYCDIARPVSRARNLPTRRLRTADRPMAGNRFQGQVVRIALFAGDPGVIRDATFERCHIKGPAVMVPIGKTVMEHNRFDGTADALLWEIPPERSKVIGAIALENCTFTECHFMNIGIAGPPDLIRAFLD